MAKLATPTQHRLVRMEIERLKSISDMEIEFVGPPLTAVMGTTCSGKTTILHALACSYAPLSGSESHGYKFPQFFKPNTDSLWQGSKFTVVSSQSLAGVVEEARTAGRHGMRRGYRKRAQT